MGSVLSLPPTYWVILGKALAISDPPFSYILNQGPDQVIFEASSGPDLSYI